MHTWLPDAHAEAPAPLSRDDVGRAARGRALRHRALEGGGGRGRGHARSPDRLLIGLGVLSLAIAAFSLVVPAELQADAGLLEHRAHGPHVRGPGARARSGSSRRCCISSTTRLAKSMMFLLAGRVLHRYRTTDIARRLGAAPVDARTGGLFAAGMLALVGLPPFGLFVSEFALLRAGFAAGRPWLMGLVLALLTVAFVGARSRHAQPHALRAAAGRRGRRARASRWALVAAGRVRGGAGRPRAHRCRRRWRALLAQHRGDRGAVTRPDRRPAGGADRGGPGPGRPASGRHGARELHCALRGRRRRRRWRGCCRASSAPS